MKSVHIRSFSGPYFHAFGLYAERYSVYFRIQSECVKTRTRKLRVRTLFSQTNNYSTQLVLNLSRSKSNQRIKFGQIKEYNMRNVFLEKTYTKCGGKTNSRAFSKKSKLSLYLNQHYEHLCSLILLYVKVEDYQNILKLKC